MVEKDDQEGFWICYVTPTATSCHPLTKAERSGIFHHNLDSVRRMCDQKLFPKVHKHSLYIDT